MPRTADFQARLKQLDDQLDNRLGSRLDNHLENELKEARDSGKLNQQLLNEAQDKLIKYAREARRAEELISFLLEQLEARRH
jgi:hypothetical protein